MAYVPGLSIVNSLVDAVEKCAIEVLMKCRPDWQCSAGGYSKYLQQKSFKDCGVEAVPFAKIGMAGYMYFFSEQWGAGDVKYDGIQVNNNGQSEEDILIQKINGMDGNKEEDKSALPSVLGEYKDKID